MEIFNKEVNIVTYQSVQGQETLKGNFLDCWYKWMMQSNKNRKLW